MNEKARRLRRRVLTLCRKETLQILRDPSTLLIAFLFPVVLLVIFAEGINLDTGAVPLGLVLEDDGAEARRFAESFAGSRYFHVTIGRSTAEMGDRLRAGKIRGFVVVRDDFATRLARANEGEDEPQAVLAITDGAEPNTAAFVSAYVRGTYEVWAREEARARGRDEPPRLALEERYWFNPSTTSRNFLLPGAITIIMTVVGALLTSLVVAREWERGTMEALLAAGVSRVELVLSKVIPYFVLGLLSFSLCAVLTIVVFGVPFRGSLFLLFLVAAMFLVSALGLGLLLSTLTRSQYNAAQAALNVAFLPAMMLSGFIFEIASMPWPIRAVTYVFAARYFVTALQTLFQAGNVWPVLAEEMACLGVLGALFMGLTLRFTRRQIE
jgi:ABC-2 type transport system permease protein